MPHVGFDGVKDDKIFKDLHETTEKDKGKKLALRDFKSPPPIDAKDVEVNPLHMIFNLKKVLVGKEYFKINHLQPLLFNVI
jgi:hypothetical protein